LQRCPDLNGRGVFMSQQTKSRPELFLPMPPRCRPVPRFHEFRGAGLKHVRIDGPIATTAAV
jgi:hypothetical protein